MVIGQQYGLKALRRAQLNRLWSIGTRSYSKEVWKRCKCKVNLLEHMATTKHKTRFLIPLLRLFRLLLRYNININKYHHQQQQQQVKQH